MRGGTGHRGISGTEESFNHPNSILNPTPQPTNHVPTKTSNFNTIQTSKGNGANTAKLSHDKTNESGLRSHLRRSYDANSGNLPHPHGIQPVANQSRPQHRPHSSSKMNTLPARQSNPQHQAFASSNQQQPAEPRDQYPPGR